MTGTPSLGRSGRITLTLLQLLAVLIAAGAIVLGVVQAVHALLDERLTVAYPVRVAIPPEELLSIPGMSIDSAGFSEVSIAVSGTGALNRSLLALSALLAAAGVAAIAVAVGLLCRRVLQARPLLPATVAALVTVATALLLGIGGSQLALFRATWSISEYWDGHPLFGGSGGIDTTAAALALGSTPLLVAAALYFAAALLRRAVRHEGAAE